MDKEQRQSEARKTLNEAIAEKVALYSYVLMILLALSNLLIVGVGMIVDANQSRNLAWLYVALAFGVLALIVLAWLSALYFVDHDEAPSKGKMKMAFVLKDLLRGFGFAVGAFLFVASLLGAGGEGSGWGAFLKGYGIAVMLVEGVVFFYGLWKNAWIQENPERYLTPIARPIEKQSSVETKESGVKVNLSSPKRIASNVKTPEAALPAQEIKQIEPQKATLALFPKKKTAPRKKKQSGK
jgi:hypothetical protein